MKILNGISFNFPESTAYPARSAIFFYKFEEHTCTCSENIVDNFIAFFRICVLFNFFSLFAKQNSEKYWKTSLEMEIHVDFAHFLPPFFRAWKLFFGVPANWIRNVAVATPLALSREKWAPTIWIKIFLIYETCQPFIKRLF